MKKKRWFKRLIKFVSALFIAMNIVACFHAYHFTHFTDKPITKTKDPQLLSLSDKIKAAVLGINNPRPANNNIPQQPYSTITLNSNKFINCWYIPTDRAIGTVILFHGYGGKKSDLLDKSNEFIKMGYNTLLVDFMGSGDSEGNQTTIGYKEAEEVKTTYDYISDRGEKNIYLFGTSLGAVAIMKAVSDYQINPSGCILECPFGSMYETTCARFHIMKIPTFPMAALVVFWGGVQNNFWAFSHNPTEYANKIAVPVLLLYGEKDNKVSRIEIDEIFNNLKGKKAIKTFADAGHENYLKHYHSEWLEAVSTFIN